MSTSKSKEVVEQCKVGVCILSELHPELTDHSTLGRRRKGKIQCRRSNQHSETLTENSIVHLEIIKRSGGESANCKVGICIFPELHAELTDCSTLGRRPKDSPVS